MAKTDEVPPEWKTTLTALLAERLPKGIPVPDNEARWARTYETDFSGPLALSLGVPEKDLMILPHRARSTLEEANAVVPDMERAGIHSMILVTSNYHTHRAKRYFLRVCKDRIKVIAYPANNDWFSPDNWWQSREGMKFFFFEATKSWTSYLE